LVEQARNEKGTLAIDYVSLVPVLVKAIQEQQETITALKARVTSLEQTIEQLSPPQAANAAYFLHLSRGAATR